MPKVVGVYCEAAGKSELREVADIKGNTVRIDTEKSKIARVEYRAMHEYAIVRGMMRTLNERQKKSGPYCEWRHK